MAREPRYGERSPRPQAPYYSWRVGWRQHAGHRAHNANALRWTLGVRKRGQRADVSPFRTGHVEPEQREVWVGAHRRVQRRWNPFQPVPADAARRSCLGYETEWRQ